VPRVLGVVPADLTRLVRGDLAGLVRGFDWSSGIRSIWVAGTTTARLPKTGLLGRFTKPCDVRKRSFEPVADKLSGGNQPYSWFYSAMV
jgi:hypothetical protein